ncbi:MAG: nucleotidyltransferase family protein [Verrucomicrobiota bacterium]
MEVKKAVILAAGKGTRMKDLTKDMPKPMALVRGKPILEYILTGLRDFAGVKDFFIVTGHCAEVVENYFKNGNDWNVSITYGRQEIPDGTGKAPELAKHWACHDSFWLIYGDILIDPSEYGEMLASLKNEALISARRGENVKFGGAVVFDENFLLKDLIEKSDKPISPWYNAGIYIFPPEIFNYTSRLQKSARGEYELTDAIRAMARGGIKIQGYEIKKSWVDVRDPQVLTNLNQSAVT